MKPSISNKLVIALATSAVLNLRTSDRIFKTQGREAYKRHHEKYMDVPFEKGLAFTFIERLLHLNKLFSDISPVEVVLFSHNTIETAQRAFRTFKHYGLDITRGCFCPDGDFFPYLPDYNVSLFLSAHEPTVRQAMAFGQPAGLVIGKDIDHARTDFGLRIGIDFDGIYADDESEAIFKEKELSGFIENEVNNSGKVHGPGPMYKLVQHLMNIRRLENAMIASDPKYVRYITMALITARCAPAHERVVTTLKAGNVEIDQAFFMGGLPKKPIIERFRPHLYLDDQITHLHDIAGVPLVHVPFGSLNQAK